MTPFCTSPLLDWDYTWSSDYPRLTSCFENTVLTYTPASLLVLFGVLPQLVRRRKKQSRYRETLSWTPLSMSRFVASLLLTLTYGFSLVNKLVSGPSSGSSVVADLVHVTSFAITMKVQESHRKNGIGSSMLLFLFWLVTVICKLPECFRHLHGLFASGRNLVQILDLEFAVWGSAYPMMLLQLFLSCWTDARKDAKRPYLTAPPVSFLLFGWLSALVHKKPERSVQMEDLYKIPRGMMTEESYHQWAALWKKELNSSGCAPEDETCRNSRLGPSLLKPLWRVYWKPVIISCILGVVRAIVRPASALFLHLLMDYMGGNGPTWIGLLYAFGMVCTIFGSALLAVHTNRTISLTGLNAKSVLVAAIYRKALRLCSQSQNDYTIGKMVNLISVDADWIFKLSTNFNYVASAAPIIMITLVLLWQYLGFACLAGIAVMFVMVPIIAVTVDIRKKYQTGQMKLKDKRLNIVAEMLNCVKVIKLFAWENFFIDKCKSLRLGEMGLLKKYSYLTALHRFLFTSMSSATTLVSFVTYVLVSDDHILDARTAFVSFALFDYLELTMFVLPDFISNLVQTNVSMTRIRKFLICPEVDNSSVGRRLNEGDAVLVKNATISWLKNKTPTLRKINLTVNTGQLIAIVGPVGSGKSSLLSALLGQLRVCSGSVDCIQNIAYAPQCPWIQNKTIRENVIFTSTYDTKLYEKVLKACCLERDLEILPGGDLTEIGEKGINLSGGQKQRVSLARAAYQMKDLYLFDDPLSAVDAHVGAYLFKNLIGPQGMLKDTTRILVTHHLAVLPEVDYIVVMQDGSVIETGTFEELKKEGTALSELLKKVSEKGEKSTGNEDILIDSEDNCKLEKLKRNIALVEKERIAEGTVGLHVYRSYIRQAGFLLLLVILCYGVYTALGVFVGIWLREWTDESLFIDGSQGRSLPIYRIVVYTLLFTFQAVAKFFAVAMLWKVALSSSTSLHQLLLEGVMRAPLSFFDVTPCGRVLNRFGKDIDQLDIQLPMAAHSTLDVFFHFAASLLLICINIPVCFLIIIPVAASLVVLRQKYVVPYRQVKRLESASRSPINNQISETVAGLSSIRSYGVEDIFIRDNDCKIDIMQTCTMNARHLKYWMDVRMEMVSELTVFFMLFLLVTSRDAIGMGLAGLLISYMMSSLSCFTYFLFSTNELEATMISAERVDEYRCLTPEGLCTSNLKPDPQWPGSGAVSFKSYSTRYRDGLGLVLRDVNLDVHPGEKLGIVGRTGAGKSTVTLSLFRIVEAASGKILVDDVDIAALGLQDLRSRITIIPQDPVLFQGTLRFNLDPAGQHDTFELWWALDRSHLADFFRQNEGLDFEVAEGGLNLSVGQRQLVCLARALLKKTKILVLDEATASVDAETDMLVQQTLRDVMSGCTVLTIAHRIHTVLTSDRVVVMDRGTIVEVGSPAELLADTTSSFYALAHEAGVVFPGVTESGLAASWSGSVPR
ncbi:multidrug resistance-associated protein 1-like [Ixodes scapularis]|uniref:multidrug resistance-associated protein 1-like n=1 Tax=Ixodes scapularis TaxID=6945 RepID=UPI001C394A05|nr:multidrug resistance-associated protein 1-like [Ixodes scapularis]